MSRNDRAAREGPSSRQRSRRPSGARYGLAVAIGPVAAQTPVLVPKVQNGADSPAPPVMAVPANAPTQKFTMAVGKSIIVDLPADASEVFVGKPEVANAVVRSARRLYVMAMGKGPTTIFALDKDGRQIATLEINVNGRDIGELAGILKTVMPDNDIRVQAVDDSIILTGTVASAVDAQRALDIASAFTGYTAVGASGGASSTGGGSSISFSARQWSSAGQIINSLVIRGQDQVTLKVQVVEMRRDIVKQLGVHLSGAWGTPGSGTSGLSSPELPRRIPHSSSAPATWLRRRLRQCSAVSVPIRRSGLRTQRCRPRAGGAQRDGHLRRDRQVYGRRDDPDRQPEIDRPDNRHCTVTTYTQTLRRDPQLHANGAVGGSDLAASRDRGDGARPGSLGTSPARTRSASQRHARTPHGGAAVGRLHRIGRPDPAVEPAGDRRHARSHESADPRRPVPVARLPASRDGIDDHRDALPLQNAAARPDQSSPTTVSRTPRIRNPGCSGA